MSPYTALCRPVVLCLFLGCAVSAEVSAMSVHYSSPSTLRLNQLMGGAFDACSTQGQVNPDGWNCPASGDLSCNSACNPCSALNGTDKVTCTAAVCWACKNLNPAQSVKRCQNTGGPGCSDFNGGQACGSKVQVTCAWDAIASECLCNTFADANVVCPRRHCSQP